MENEKRKSKTSKLAHKLPLIHETQLLFKAQEEYNSTYIFFPTSKCLNHLILFSGLWLKNFCRVLPRYLVVYCAEKSIDKKRYLLPDLSNVGQCNRLNGK